MSDKKHIDRLFQETFKDFEMAPSDAVWDRIESQLTEKKKRRVIPIWWRSAGIAASLLLLLTIGTIYYKNLNLAPSQQVVDTEENNASNDFKEIQKNEEKNNINNTTETTNTIVNNNTIENNQENHSNEKQSNLIHISNRESSVANVSSKNNLKTKTDKNSLFNKTTINNTYPLNTQNDVVMANSSKEIKETSEKNTPLLDKAKTDATINSIKNNNEAIVDAKNEDVEDKLMLNNSDKTALTIEEAIEKTKDIDEEEKEKLNRWSVSPNAAPVFFNSLGKGSSIDPQFNNNSKSGEVNMSYGINASYAVNNKLSVRSGINKVNLGYNTNDVVVFQSLGDRSSIRFLENVKPDINNASNDVSFLSTESFANKGSESFVEGTSVNTSISQSLSYIEIPLEIKYMLSDKKLGVNVIGGFSSFFLNNNELYSDIEGNKISIGEASNVNNVSYSANFGFGLNYKVTKKINLNLEPMFKYQINTFNNTSGDFKPFFIGVYTGFGLKF